MTQHVAVSPGPAEHAVNDASWIIFTNTLYYNRLYHDVTFVEGVQMALD